MDYCDMAECLRKELEKKPTHHHPDFDGLEDKLRNHQMVGRSQRGGVRPQIAELADWCKTVSQGNTGRIVSLMQ